MKKQMVIRATPEMDAELREILDGAGPERIQKGDLTREAAMEYWGIARAQANVRLARLVSEGKFTKHLIVLDKHVHTVWRKAVKGKK